MDYETFPAARDDRHTLDAALLTAWQDLAAFGLPTPKRPDVSLYFRSLGGILAALTGVGQMKLVADVMLHVDYLADKASLSPNALLGGEPFCIDQQFILDGIDNIGFVLRAGRETTGTAAATPDTLPPDVMAMIAEAETRLAGWCTREKAVCIAETIVAERPLICVEIGIFGGRSLIPAAAALRHNGLGVIYGIEAWSPVVAVQNATNQANDDWWSKVDFGRIKHDFYRFVTDMELTRQVRLIEAPSGKASAMFDDIDFLHIDGSHSVVNAAEDVILYARKVRPGGIIVFDDVNWQSTAPARELLATLCDTEIVLKDPASGLDICAVLRRR
jgi:predicted O-methyltransferase YrrM